MTPNEICRDLKNRFTWESDGKLDSYHILKGEGKVKGDCDDYAVTILYNYCGVVTLSSGGYWLLSKLYSGSLSHLMMVLMSPYGLGVMGTQITGRLNSLQKNFSMTRDTPYLGLQ